MDKDIRKVDDDILITLDKLNIPEPSDTLKNSFMNRAEKEFFSTKSEPATLQLSFFIKAAAVAIIFCAGWFGNAIIHRNDNQRLENLEAQLNQNNKLLILSLIQQSSASDRLEAAYVSSNSKTIDNQIAMALSNALMYDTDPNVRMKCAEALAYHLKPDSLYEIFSNALPFQNDPYLQLTLVNYIGMTNNQESKTFINNFLKSGNVDEFVSSEIKKTINIY